MFTAFFVENNLYFLREKLGQNDLSYGKNLEFQSLQQFSLFATFEQFFVFF